MGQNNTQLLKTAEKYLDSGGAKFRKFCGLSGNAPYCNAYVCYILSEGGDAGLYYGGKKVTYCPTSIKWCQANLAQIPIYLAMPMDIVYFDWDLNNVPNHIGFARKRASDQTLMTIEGNTSKVNEKTGKVLANGVVAYRTRPVKYIQGVFRLHFAPKSIDTTSALKIDGEFDYNSIACLQRALGCKADGILKKSDVKALQKLVGVTQDGSWGAKTSKAVQKMVGTTVDGYFGANSVKALQKWINKKLGNSSTTAPAKTAAKSAYSGTFPSGKYVTKLSYAEVVQRSCRDLAFPEGTAPSKYKYKHQKGTKVTKWDTDRPTEANKKAMDKIFPRHWAWGSAKYGYGQRTNACCDDFASLVVRHSGLDTSFPHAVDTVSRGAYSSPAFDKAKFTKKSQLAPGSIVGYARANKTGHVYIYYGGGKVCEAAINKNYGHFAKIASARYAFGSWTTAYIYTPKNKYINETKDYLAKGDTGDQVELLQNYLTWYGIKLTADGIFGEATFEAVKKFQKAECLTVDGVFGPKSLAKARETKK